MRPVTELDALRERGILAQLAGIPIWIVCACARIAEAAANDFVARAVAPRR